MRFGTLLALLAPIVAPAAQVYSWDNGTALFSTVSGSNQVQLVGFQAEPGKLKITGMEFFNYWNADNGHAITYLLWTDPTNDGNPADAIVAQSVNTTYNGTAKGNWQTETFSAPTTFNPGDWFYVGVYMTDPVFSSFIGGTDNAPSTGNSWTFNFPHNTAINLSNLGPSLSSVLRYISPNTPTGNLLIRALAEDPAGSGVPEPSSVACTIGGLLVMAGIVRRRK